MSAGKTISPNAKLAVISAEDQLFPDHHGFDWKSIKKARRYNARKPGESMAPARSVNRC
jgi:monofunctional biosynthetic peptidoglycan transglycosylase